MPLVTNRYFLPVTRALLTTSPPMTPLELFRNARIPKSPGYRALKFYEVHGAVRTTRGIEADPRRILTLQGGLRAERAIPDRAVPRGPPLERTIRLLADLHVPYAVGFQTAANMHAYFEPAAHHALYIGRVGKPGTAPLALVEDALRTDHAATKQEPYDLFVDDLDRLEVQHTSRGSLTSPIQTLLDLCLHTRTAAHREFLFDQLQKQGVLRG